MKKIWTFILAGAAIIGAIIWAIGTSFTGKKKYKEDVKKNKEAIATVKSKAKVTTTKKAVTKAKIKTTAAKIKKTKSKVKSTNQANHTITAFETKYRNK